MNMVIRRTMMMMDGVVMITVANNIKRCILTDGYSGSKKLA